MLTSMPQLSMQIWLLIGQINENKAWSINLHFVIIN
jgi:hypothetical protein